MTGEYSYQYAMFGDDSQANEYIQPELTGISALGHQTVPSNVWYEATKLACAKTDNGPDFLRFIRSSPLASILTRHYNDQNETKSELRHNTADMITALFACWESVVSTDETRFYNAHRLAALPVVKRIERYGHQVSDTETNGHRPLLLVAYESDEELRLTLQQLSELDFAVLKTLALNVQNGIKINGQNHTLPSILMRLATLDLMPLQDWPLNTYAKLVDLPLDKIRAMHTTGIWPMPLDCDNGYNPLTVALRKSASSLRKQPAPRQFLEAGKITSRLGSMLHKATVDIWNGVPQKHPDYADLEDLFIIYGADPSCSDHLISGILDDDSDELLRLTANILNIDLYFYDLTTHGSEVAATLEMIGNEVLNPSFNYNSMDVVVIREVMAGKVRLDAITLPAWLRDDPMMAGLLNSQQSYHSFNEVFNVVDYCMRTAPQQCLPVGAIEIKSHFQPRATIPMDLKSLAGGFKRFQHFGKEKYAITLTIVELDPNGTIRQDFTLEDIISGNHPQSKHILNSNAALNAAGVTLF